MTGSECSPLPLKTDCSAGHTRVPSYVRYGPKLTSSLLTAKSRHKPDTNDPCYRIAFLTSFKASWAKSRRISP
jgi:hypothetical protein